MRNLLLAGVILGVVGCAHATKTHSGEQTPEEKKADEKKDDGKKDDDKKDGPGAKKAPARVETMTTSQTTKEMFKEDGIKKIQQALDVKLKKIKPPKDDKDNKDNKDKDGKQLQSDKGPETSDKKKGEQIKEVKVNDRLDDKTQLALQQFQKSEGLPETGLPDYETLRRLGLKPEDIYHHDTPSERVGVQ